MIWSTSRCKRPMVSRDVLLRRLSLAPTSVWCRVPHFSSPLFPALTHSYKYNTLSVVIIIIGFRPVRPSLEECCFHWT